MLINSSVGRKGNVGYRAAKVFKSASNRQIVTYLFARYSKEKYNLNFNQYEKFSRGLNFFRIYIWNSFNHVKYDNYFFQILEKFFGRSKVLADEKLKIIHAWGPYCDSLKYYKEKGFKILLDVPIASQRHAKEILGLKHPEQKKMTDLSILDQTAYDLADIIIVPSKFVGEGISRNYFINPAKINVVPFGVDFSEFCNERVYSTKITGLKYIFAGNINRRKGILDLLEAWDVDDFKNDELILCGRVFPEVSKALQKKTRGGKIKCVGYVEIAPFLRNSDIFVFPTYFEGSAKCVYEALASGLPVITTYNSGSIITDRSTGLIVEAGDVENIRAAMIKLKYDHELRSKIGKAGKIEVGSYSWSRYSDSICELYESLGRA